MVARQDTGGASNARLPRPVPGELARTGLITRLAERFHASVTTVVAGPGFGKSTVLAQALRHNEVAPLGIDAWVTCGPGSEEGDRLAASILDALAHRPDVARPPIDEIVQAIVDRSPLDVCIVVDDCHLVPPGSSGEALLADLIRRLPSNGHLVLSGRWLPDVPLARLQAQARLLALTDRDLAFDDAEVRAAADRAGQDPDAAADLGGWPALVRLALAVGPGVDRQFLREEVLNSLPPERRRELLALVVLGPSTEADVARLVGEPVDLGALALAVPMVTVDDRGVLTAHQLWDDTLVSTTEPSVVSAVRRRAVEMLLEASELPRAASIAIDDGDWHALGRAALELVRRTLTGLPVDTARTWLDAVPATWRSPSIDLLEAALRHAHNTRDPRVDALIDDAIARFSTDGDVDGACAAIGLAAVAAHGRADLGRLAALAVRAVEIPADHRDPVVDMLVHALPGALADLAGDPEGVLAALAPVQWDAVPLEISLTPMRLWVQAMWMCGRAGETIDIAERHLSSLVVEDHVRRTSALSRWFAGDPDGFADHGRTMAFEPVLNERDQFVGSCFSTVIMASAGSRETIDAIWGDGSIEALAFDNARDHAHLTSMRAARAVLAHDESTARDRYREHLEQHPLTDRLGERHLRRWPALGTVLSPVLRDHWRSCELGPAHRRAVQCGDALLAARESRVAGTDLAPPQLYTQLPLPWSVELAVRWEDLGASEAATALIAYLADRLGDACTAELDHVRRTAPDLATAGERLARQLPAVPPTSMEILVLGPLEIRRGDRVVDAPELRRSRVRQLLELLVVEPSVRRERILDLLWPDMAPDKAAGNLRVTLAHLRRLLEPDRGPGDPGFHLRSDGTTVSLHRSDHLRVDLWEFERSAARLASTLSLPDQAQILASMADLWRGAPLVDLRDVGSHDSLTDRLVLRHVSTLMRLGELRIAEGAPDAALACADSLIEIDPFREQAHRLAVAAHLQMGDTAGARRALDRLGEMLDELGVSAEPATEILRRQVAARGG